MKIHIFGKGMLREITEKITWLATHSKSAIALSYRQVIGEMTEPLLTNEQVNKLLDEMQQQICDNKTAMQKVLDYHFDYFEAMIDQRALITTVAELFEKGIDDFKRKRLAPPIPKFKEFLNGLPKADNSSTYENIEKPDFAKHITASEAKEIAKNNQRDYDLMKVIAADVRSLSFEGKYRHIYKVPNPTAADMLLERLLSLGYRVKKVQQIDSLELEINWD